MKQIIFISTIILLISCGQSSDKIIKQEASLGKPLAQNDAIAVKNALRFINLYIEIYDEKNSDISLEEHVNSTNLTTYRFRKDLRSIINEAKKNEPELGLESDPIVDAQDHPDEGFVFESFDEKTNLIVVKGKDWPEFKVTIKMVLDNNNWLVDGCGIVNLSENNPTPKSKIN